MAVSSQPGARQETGGAVLIPQQSGTRKLLEKWRRRVRGLLYALVALFVGAFVWRTICLIGLPDVGAPFDVAAFRSYHVAPDEDAFIAYREAGDRLTSVTIAQDLSGAWKTVRGGWGKASPDTRAWVTANRDALITWRRGTEKPKAMPIVANARESDWGLPKDFKNLMAFTCLAVLEGSRLEESGDMAGAWGWYNASLRASRHVLMHAPSNYHSWGATFYDMTVQRIPDWAANPRTDAASLRHALHDMHEIITMTPPNSEMVKGDYIAVLDMLDHPNAWLKHHPTVENYRSAFPTMFRTVVFLKREPERSRRVANLLFAHWLAHADDAPKARPKMAETRVDGNHTYPDFPYYAAPGQVDAAHPLSNEKLYAWHQSTVYLKSLGIQLIWTLPQCDSERSGQQIMLITLAEQLYQREHGALPQAAEDLVSAGYLIDLPEGYAKDHVEPEQARK